MLVVGVGIVYSAAPAPINSDENVLKNSEKEKIKEWNNKIRRDKFDIILPKILRKHKIDMWIHVMRIAIPDQFGAEELGSTSGVFVFTDRGGDRIERAILGRRWGSTQRNWGEQDHQLVEKCGAYDIVGKSVFVSEPIGSPMLEYDFRFKGLREFVKTRNPKRIAVNFIKDLGMWETYTDFGGAKDGLSHTDYLLLEEELGDKFSKRLVSSEYLIMEYITRKVPSEIKLLKKIRMDNIKKVKKAFSKVVPGVTNRREARVTIFRRRSTGVSQRGRSEGFGGNVIQRGDIIASPSQGMYAYVLRENETAPPPEIQKLWKEYLKIDKILAETIKAGLTPREIKKNYMKKFKKAGIIVRENQMHMMRPKNNFPSYTEGYEPGKTHLSIDCHGMMKGARNEPDENYLGPRISSLGPTWAWDIPLPMNHHFVLEYFFYMPSPGKDGEDQYLLWWDHEQSLATDKGVQYLSQPQKELYLIK